MKFHSRSLLCGLSAFVLSIFFSGCSKNSDQLKVAEKSLSEFVNATYGDVLKSAMIESVEFDHYRCLSTHPFHVGTSQFGEIGVVDDYYTSCFHEYSISLKDGTWIVSGLEYDVAAVDKAKAIHQIRQDIDAIVEVVRIRSQVAASWSSPVVAQNTTEPVWQELPDGE